MRIHADLGLPAIVRTHELPWIPSPVPGVDRRMLERDGDEVARATSLVRYAPRSRFSEHVHGGGEEILVLAGSFADEHGEFPAGTYLRNPVGSAHSPRSEDGCVLFVKLHWMHADDRETVRARLDQPVADDGWTPLEGDRSSEDRRALARDPSLDGDRDRIAGVSLRHLHAFRDESTSWCRMAPGAAVEGWPNPGGLELLVIDGSCKVERQRLGRHGWARMPPGCAPTLASSEGCSLLLKQGHLRRPPPLPSRPETSRAVRAAPRPTTSARSALAAFRRPLCSPGMSKPLVHSLDHIVLRVRDLAAATDSYRRLLGREPSWRGEHPQWGTRNTLFRLDNTYVELLSAPESAEGPFARARGEPAEGPFMLAFGVADADDFQRRAEERGLRPSPPQPGQGANLDTGAVREWRNVFLPREETHGARLFAIEHRSPPDALPPAPRLGADAAAAVDAVDHVVVRTRDGDRARRLYGETLGIRLALDRAFPDWGARLLFFRLGDLTLEIAAALEPPPDPAPSEQAAQAHQGDQAAGDAFWGVSYRVADAHAAKRRLDAAGIPATEVRFGRKPGTRVLTVEGGTHGVPTLFLQPAARA